MAAQRERAQTTNWLGRVSIQQLIGKVVLYGILLPLALFYALPLLWAVSSSLKSEPQVLAIPPVWIPNPVLWRNYPEALTFTPFFKYIRNTLIIAFPSLVGILVSSTLVAYGFSRLQWKWRDFFFFLCISTMMIPFQVRMIPLYIIFYKLGWLNTYRPLIIPHFFGSAYYIFLLRQFFLTIPRDLSDAAKVDGCSELGIMMRIILPLSRPVLAVVGLYHIMWVWNDFMGPLIYINKDDLYTIAIGLTRYRTYMVGRSTWAWLMAASVTSIAPILVLFFFTQRTFIEGITLTGIKG